jgi:replicative DNA helicase
VMRHRSIRAEQALLGAILVNNDAFYGVSRFLQSGHFSEDVHRRIYEACARQIRTGRVATVITLETILAGAETPEGLSLQAYLARLAASAVTIAGARECGRMIYNGAMGAELPGRKIWPDAVAASNDNRQER